MFGKAAEADQDEKKARNPISLRVGLLYEALPRWGKTIVTWAYFGALWIGRRFMGREGPA